MSRAAIIASRPRTLQSRVLKAAEECREVRSFRLEVPEDFSFVPGMWVMLNFPDSPKLARAYSISSSPFEKGYIETSANKVGPLTSRLFELKEGETLTLRGPYGKWIYQDDLRHAVLISGGTGITPLRSMCRYVLERKLPNKLTLLYSSKTPSEILYRGELARFAEQGIKVYLTVTRPQAMKPGEAWGGPTGRLDIDVISREVEDFSEARYYLCGPISLVEDLTAALLAAGIPRKRIRYEKWGDY